MGGAEPRDTRPDDRNPHPDAPDRRAAASAALASPNAAAADAIAGRLVASRIVSPTSSPARAQRIPGDGRTAIRHPTTRSRTPMTLVASTESPQRAPTPSGSRRAAIPNVTQAAALASAAAVVHAGGLVGRVRPRNGRSIVESFTSKGTSGQACTDFRSRRPHRGSFDVDRTHEVPMTHMRLDARRLRFRITAIQRMVRLAQRDVCRPAHVRRSPKHHRPG